MGRLHDSKVDKWLEDDNLMLLMCWSRDGYTIQDIATRIGINGATLSMWRKQYPEIKQAIDTGKEIPDYKVENALYKVATGYKTTEVKMTKEKNGMGQMVVTKIERVDKDIAPNVSAISMWLSNRNPNKWKKNRDNEDNTDSNDTNITLNIIRKNPNNTNESGQNVANEEDEEWVVETKKDKHKKDTMKEQKNSDSEIDDDAAWDDVIAETEEWD